MILLNGPNTPFGRIALATALELQLDVDNRTINVFESNFLDGINPLRQIPTLILGDATMLCDSRVICSYFCSLRPDAGLIPVEDRWHVETRWALIIGLMETSVGRVMECLRPPTQRSDSYVAKCDRRIRNTLEYLEKSSDAVCRSEARIDRLAAAVALEYIDFRLGREWRAWAPTLGRWLEVESQRPSLAACRPRERLASDPTELALRVQ